MKRHLHFIYKHLLSFAAVAAFCLAISGGAKAGTVRSFKDSLLFSDTFGHPLTGTKLVTCYPNPATSYINFKFDKTIPASSRLLIYSFSGRKMDELNVKDNLIKISLDNYFRGLYIYQLRDTAGNIIESGRFQVKN
ncbi:T9SS type A sorting domain-containing protein [Arachidicoccus ginsenosidimutans]|uniref:T9SS type A sorting domain-containing protein n=1 Tax=Arachidicoccus sp. BS20 TaxID=1850526 RepID=UPI0018D39485|nr:T9SS type A sorting domain-containing protein [Arachidicoccus sp. BS20]